MIVRKNLLFAECVANHMFWPFLLRVGNLPRSTLPLILFSHPRSTTCVCLFTYQKHMDADSLSDVTIMRLQKWRRIMSTNCQTNVVLIKDYVSVRIIGINTVRQAFKTLMKIFTNTMDQIESNGSIGNCL